MKVVILAGGYGTRISEESHLIPKPMIQIGEMPIIWHIMKIYSHYGYNDFVICLGYKQNVVRDFFANYYLHTSDVTFDFAKNNMTVHSNTAEPWKITLVDTGIDTMTGGRIKRIQKYIGDEPFMLTYGDGLSDVNINELEKFHRENKKLATITAVTVDQRFGVLGLDGTDVNEFREKSSEDVSRINGGFMVMEPQVFDYIKGDDTVFEKEPLETLATEGQLNAFLHDGFWKPMDTQREKMQLEQMWESGNAKWKIW